jgi:hypothetical protein
VATLGFSRATFVRFSRSELFADWRDGWGRMQIWCQGDSIGDFSEGHCALYPPYLGFTALQRSLPTLWLPELNGFVGTDLWNHFDALLYGYHGDVELNDDRSLHQLQWDARHYGKFDFLTNWGEQSDRDGKSFIVCKFLTARYQGASCAKHRWQMSFTPSLIF